MYYLIAAILIIFSFSESILKKSSFRFLIGIPVFAIFFVLQAYNEWSPDMMNYRSYFDYIDNELISQTVEPIHKFLIKATYYFHGDFSDFIFVYGVLIVSFLFLNVYYYSPLPIFFMCCYFLVPFFPNIIQIRFFLAINVLILGVRFLDKKNLIFYGILVLSIMCHVSMVVMIPFLFIRKFAFFNDYKRANWLLIVVVFVLLFVPPTIVSPLVNLIAPKFSRYLGLVSISRFLGTIALFLPFFVLSMFCLWHYNVKFQSFKHKIPQSILSKLPIMMGLIQYSNFTIIPQYFARDFWRLSMNLSFFSLAYLTICIYYGWGIKFSEVKAFMSKFAIYFYFIFILYFVFLMLNGGEYMEIIRQTIESNALLKTI